LPAVQVFVSRAYCSWDYAVEPLRGVSRDTCVAMDVSVPYCFIIDDFSGKIIQGNEFGWSIGCSPDESDMDEATASRGAWITQLVSVVAGVSHVDDDIEDSSHLVSLNGLFDKGSNDVNGLG
jgi:hypothetical protein